VSSALNASLAELVRSRTPGYSLPGGFYAGAELYAAELETIWRRGWLFAAHACELREPGDWLTLTVGDDPLLIARAEDGGLRAFHNVCRHRGTLLCRAEAGHAKRIVCPYHQWAYSLDGALVASRGMQADLEREALGLSQVHLECVGGLIFVCLAQEPPDFAPVRAELEPMLRPQGLERAKVARHIDYVVAANWKLVWENNRECYHCVANHPEYVRANHDHRNEDDTSEALRAEIEAAVLHSRQRWVDAGLELTHAQSGMAPFPDPEGGRWWSVNRTVLVQGWVSESLDGRQVAPLMGDYPEPDVGTLRVRSMPNLWNHSSCDHSVSTRLLPDGPDRTKVRVSWLVHEDAVEGRDYELERLLPYWRCTSEQDWELCEVAQRGVRSSGYRPGPLSTHKEYNVDAFLRWYLAELTRDGGCS